MAAGATIRRSLYSPPMSEGKAAGQSDAADLEDLARRFQDLWREQMAATVADPEFMEMMSKWMAALTAGIQQVGASTAPPPVGMPGMAGIAGATGPLDPSAWMAALRTATAGAKGASDDRGAAQAGAASAAAASGTGDVAGDELKRRLAALEQRVERLEAGLGRQGRAPAKGTRRRKS